VGKMDIQADLAQSSLIRNMDKKAELKVKIVPGSKCNQICQFMNDGALKIKISAKPVEGKANQELVRFLSEILKIRKTDIQVKSGISSRNKLLEIWGIDSKEIISRLSNWMH